MNYKLRMTNFKQLEGLLLVCALAWCVAVSSCSKMNDLHDKYLEGEIIYAAKVDSVAVQAGKGRALLNMNIRSQRIEFVRIFWNNYTDSADLAIGNQVGIFPKTLEHLAENSYIFQLVGFDKFGNRSLPFEVSGNVYGDRFQSKLSNRVIQTVSANNAGLTVNWSGSTDNSRGCDLIYTDKSGKEQTRRVPVNETVTVIPDWWSGMRYRTLFLPEPTAIDTFYTEWKILGDILYKPDQVYVTGGGSEGGDDTAKAHKMRSVASGEFEVYTRLEAGKPYCFIDGNSGVYHKFHTTADGLLKENGTSTIATGGVYRITLNFNNGTSTYTLITRIGFFFSPSNVILFDLPYAGYGVFQTRATVTFKQESWGRDERYKFRMFVKENGGTAAEKEREWATQNATDAQPTATSPESYYYMRLIDVLSQWDNKWKLMTAFDGVEATYTIYLTADRPYTHSIAK